MDDSQIAKAALTGLVEGATEFIPVSSTGHLILVGHGIGFLQDRPAAAATFEVFIQLGAILAVLWLYRTRFLGVVTRVRSEPGAQRLVRNLALGALPAAAAGFVLHGWIKEHLFAPVSVAAALVLGGVAILVVERWHPAPRVADADAVPPRTALGIGLFQVLALLPGVSRSGATIMGGLTLGLSRVAATEFSFFLAVPVMIAATAFDLVASRDVLVWGDAPVFAVGFVVSFLSSVVVIKALLAFVSRHTFAVFGWYRIVLGIVLLALWVV